MARMIFIGLLAFFAIACIGIGFGMYYWMKRTMVDGHPIIDQPVNEQTRTDKMGIGELLVYVSLIVIAALLAISVMQEGGSGSAILAKAILLPAVMALFNARKRTGKAMLALVISFMIALFLMMANLLIGLPQKPPVLTINNVPISVTKTTVTDLLNSGFDIYIKRTDNPDVEYKELISSGSYEKYPANRSVMVEKGIRRSNSSIPYPNIIARNGVILGSMQLYGDEAKDMVLEDCKILSFILDEDCIAIAKENSISYKLNGMDLLSVLKKEKLKKKFGEHLWSVPDNKADMTQMFYGLKWGNNSSYLFWNEYYATICFDKEDHMTFFELFGEIARE
ncbi:hypothetical protein GCWU000282_02672 [Catonella morbi ATCC 51271]|uniref:Uncharacterized protein n=1 Tax=Catonella morbi ATCC 51271 TaxID=592026 RepID=V2Y4B3_9FIRM|nr:hypothetical protein [Catonella morbi]ESL02536.1 hypothetical protein GCWU000282_02672 [Catonella morbi ATCC 51271]